MPKGIYDHWKLKKYYELNMATNGFKKGSVAWNRGIEGIMKPNKTSFQREYVAFKIYYRGAPYV